jgi:hypothetical protein
MGGAGNTSQVRSEGYSWHVVGKHWGDDEWGGWLDEHPCLMAMMGMGDGDQDGRDAKQQPGVISHDRYHQIYL